MTRAGRVGTEGPTASSCSWPAEDSGAGGCIFLGPRLVTSRMGVAAWGLFCVGRTHLWTVAGELRPDLPSAERVPLQNDWSGSVSMFTRKPPSPRTSPPPASWEGCQQTGLPPCWVIFWPMPFS